MPTNRPSPTNKIRTPEHPPSPMVLPHASEQVAAQRGTRNEQEAAEIAAQLVNLDQRKVAVHIRIQGREQLVFGVGDYQVDPDLGGVLRVQELGCANGPEL